MNWNMHKVGSSNCIEKLSAVEFRNEWAIEVERMKLEKLVDKQQSDLYYNFLVKITYENLYESNSSFILKKLREINTAIELDNNAAD
ncbi:hypothetical protein [Chryseobacterium sediminis]|uniref:Uncharacterized protein n=1 Tax=Chryseobacterium sediminis TaxID=1679494 RepID=A0A5B2U9F6_9FLAO|nr:hypothetical protein [Chryseobacterium sediminis]KAA2223040.1 hypothetical protein FW780_02210 [Chryseobacterium sediminis]